MRFYYLRNPEDQRTGQLVVYHFNVNIFRSSSFILAAVLPHHLLKYNLEHTALDIWKQHTCGQPRHRNRHRKKSKNLFEKDQEDLLRGINEHS